MAENKPKLTDGMRLARASKVLVLAGSLFGLDISPAHADTIIQIGIFVYAVITAVEAKISA